MQKLLDISVIAKEAAHNYETATPLDKAGFGGICNAYLNAIVIFIDDGIGKFMQSTECHHILSSGNDDVDDDHFSSASYQVTPDKIQKGRKHRQKARTMLSSPSSSSLSTSSRSGATTKRKSTDRSSSGPVHSRKSNSNRGRSPPTDVTPQSSPPAKRPRKSQLHLDDTEEDDELLDMLQESQMQAISSTQRKSRKKDKSELGNVSDEHYAMRLFACLASDAPQRALTWDDLEPGTQAEGQREQSALVNVMAVKLIDRPYSYLTMKKMLVVVAKNMTKHDLDTLDRKHWKGPFYVQSGGQHIRGVQQAMLQPETRKVMIQPQFRPSYELYGGKNMTPDLWQRLVTETQASQEVFTSWRFLEKVHIGREYLKSWDKMANRDRLEQQQTKTMAALFPTQRRVEALYERIRLMRCSDEEFNMMLDIDNKEAKYDLCGQQRPKDWETPRRQVCHFTYLLTLLKLLCIYRWQRPNGREFQQRIGSRCSPGAHP